MIYGPVYPDVTIYLDEDGDGIPETDISSLVVSAISGQHGNTNADDTDRTSSSGKISFEIENKDGNYTGIYFIGKAVSIVLDYASRVKQVYYGKVQGPTIDDSGPFLPRHIKLTIPDWFHVSNNTRLTGLELTTFKRSNEALDSLLDILVNPPARRDLDVGVEVFENMFDGAGPKSKIFAELDRLTKSELGQIYLVFRPDGVGEVIRLENQYSRGSLRPLSRIPRDVADAPLLKYHGNAGASGLLKYHKNGTSGYIKISRAKEANFNAQHYHADWQSGRILVNDATITNVFRTTDTTDVVLYDLQYPLKIGSTQIEEITGGYTNPGSGTIIQAFDVSIQATDVEFNSQSDGLGTDLTANLRNAGQGLYANRFFKSFFNAGPAGYLIKFKVKGKGIYKNSPNEIIIENTQSQDKLGTVYAASLTREYSNDTVSSRVFAKGLVALRRLPNSDLLSVSYQGNKDEEALMRFMYLEQGDKVGIGENYPDHQGNFYIQGVKFTIDMEGVLDYTWFVREGIETLCQPIVVQAPVNSARVALDYGILPRLANMPAYSYSFRIRRTSASAFGAIIGRSVDTGSGRRGNNVYIANRTIIFESYKTPTDGEWEAISAIPNDTNWHHVTIAYDNLSDQADPIITVDGAVATLTETETPVGQSDDDSDVSTILFNLGPNPAVVGQKYYYDVVQDFELKDVRIYNRALTPAEAVEINAAPSDWTTVPDGKVFHGIYVPTANKDKYVGDTIDDQDMVLEIVQGAGGTPYNENTASSATMITGDDI